METAVNRQQALQMASWRCSWLLNQLKTGQIAAASLIVLWASLVITVDFPLLRETRQMTMQLTSIPEPKRARPAALDTAPRYSAKDFIVALPEYDTYPDQLRDLNVLADKSGVVVTRVDYQYVTLTALPIERLVMHMAIKGTDLQQRRFLQAMLNTFPNLSIARLAYAKNPNDSMKIEQKLDIHLYYRTKAAK
ncbi:hypothetical protein WK43_03160 [Burkholderia ubonensis]|uniref:Pilus assembly protein PilO n=1 Tax=Burkholderia ubonensis TaxID=101571 RepID=A0A107EBD3_9BURK|nr:hypothetical protein WM29_25545 [Burkholderia ubonensis]KVS40619.1 hypothetical protein WK37_22335 [Burkholderia ubonensis]KVS51236.1 hypothetical protein WK38_13280 [Burkholderia ubonensis]KVS76239.1 hypothetical protein WK42_18920 [Burkholderia ubonensis]KVS78477.1 hypothetical protein WK43_03160 [Burkholderia ubonensis]